MSEKAPIDVRKEVIEVVNQNKGCAMGIVLLTLTGGVAICLTQMLASTGENLMQLFEQAPEALFRIITLSP